MNNKLQLSIPTMKCGGCVSAIEGALNTELGLQNVVVDLANKTVALETSVAPELVIDAIKSAGFDASEVKGQTK